MWFQREIKFKEKTRGSYIITDEILPNISVTKGRLNLGIWRGIYLCEHRNYAGDRNLVIIILGE